MGEEMAEKKAAAEKEVELLRKAVEESVSLARVEVDVEVPDTENFCEKKCQDNTDIGNSDPDSTGELDDELGNLREINSKYRPFRDTNASDRTETTSVRSFSTTASTIHPDVVKARVKSALEKRGKKGQAKRQVVKGEASAKTRSRNNKDTIASSTSAFWEG